MANGFRRLKDEIKNLVNQVQARPQVTRKGNAVITNSVPLNTPRSGRLANFIGNQKEQYNQNPFKYALRQTTPGRVLTSGITKDFIVRPTVRTFVEGGKTLMNVRQPEMAKPGIGQYLMGKEPIRHYQDPQRPARQLTNKIGAPSLAMPLILGGAALDAVPIGVDDVVRKGGTKIAKKVGTKSVVKEGIPKVTKKATSLLDEAKKFKSADEQSLFATVDKYASMIKNPEKANEVSKSVQDVTNALRGKDIGSFRHSWSDVFRNFRKVFGKEADSYGVKFLQKFDDAKRPYIDDTTNWANALNTNIVKGLGIKPKSKLSALVQKYGEKLITLDELKRRAPKDWQKVVQADQWFRTQYDDLIDQINASRKSIYGDVLAKVKAVEDEITSMKKDLDTKGIELNTLKQGRTYKTYKEIGLESQIKKLKEKAVNVKDQEKLLNLQKKIQYKEGLLNKARSYLQPSEKKIQGGERQYKRLEELLNKKREILESEQLWRGKFIPKRENYYRHFKEFADGYKGLLNIFDTPAQIPAELVGISDETKPFSKFLSLAQKRKGDKATYDAVTGFVDYIRSAAYAKNIDPQVKGLYDLADELRISTGTGTKGAGSANNFIEFVEDFARSLSGKTNPLDRGVQKFTGRKAFRFTNWVNNRVKVNMVLGNVASAVNQFAAIPNAIADAGPANSIKAMGQVMKKITGDGIDPRKVSTFVGERYLDEVFEPFEVGMLKYPKRMAKWMIKLGDKTATNFTFYAEYEAALSKGLKGQDAINFAQNRTRDIVAGRGIGEVPIGQQSKVMQFVAPFQLEVANQWLLFKDWIDEKTFGKFVTLAVTAHVFNEATERITGNRVLPDPFEYLADGIQAYQDEGGDAKGVAKLGLSILGGFASQIPGATNVAGFMPEQMRQEWFGEQDPGRYGAGSPLTKAVKKSVGGLAKGDPTDLITYIGLPFGGTQVRKTIGGLKAADKGGQMNDKGNLNYPIDNSVLSKIQAIVFGPYANEHARLYFKENLSVLTKAETSLWKQSIAEGKDPINTWTSIQRMKITRNYPDKISDVMRDKDLTPSEKRDKIADITREYKVLMDKLGEHKEGSVDLLGDDTEREFVPSENTGALQLKTKKKGRKPAAPSMPKLQMSKTIKGNYAKKYPDLAYDITFLQEQGVMPEFSFQ